MFVVDIAAALAYYGAVRGYIAQYDGACTQLAARANFDRAKDGCACTYYDIVAYGGMAFAYIFARAAQGYALINHYIVANLTGFAYNHPCAMVYENSIANDRAGVDFYARKKAG